MSTKKSLEIEQFKEFLREHHKDVEEHLATEEDIKKLIEEEEEWKE